MERIRKISGFGNRIDIGANGSKEGLSLGWKEEVDITLRIFSNSHINVDIKEELEEKIWRFTRFYGAPVEGLRKDSWNLIRHLENECGLPWVMMGDFNEIMFSFEKKGGRV
ncbi:hypothetical protein CXB51_034417 [Gossypium anomalum]|uniref:Endonuclease/exonuclease/phosphatase domain-containing protein n=1 Tax=Gossypium anomalum TaxID=47600 RepID=A0A8J5Y1C9_9ROSI|nr:hypothetical protein CXB51_034417 [Gossypium anomalum]